MTWNILYSDTVLQHHIPALSAPEKIRLRKAIEDKLQRDPVSFGKFLQYSLKGLRRLRIGDFRVIFSLDSEKKRVHIVAIAHRKEAYN